MLHTCTLLLSDLHHHVTTSTTHYICVLSECYSHCWGVKHKLSWLYLTGHTSIFHLLTGHTSLFHLLTGHTSLFHLLTGHTSPLIHPLSATWGIPSYDCDLPGDFPVVIQEEYRPYRMVSHTYIVHVLLGERDSTIMAPLVYGSSVYVHKKCPGV